MLVVSNRKNAIGIRRVLADCSCNYALEFIGTAGVDALDARVRIGRMQNLANQHTREAEVVGIFARPRGLARGVDHSGRLADRGVVTHSSRVIPSEGGICFLSAGNLIWPPRSPSAPPQSPT